MQKYLRRLILPLREMSWLEWVGVALTLIVVPYWLNSQGWSWKACLLLPLLLVMGYMMGDMIYMLWFPRRR